MAVGTKGGMYSVSSSSQVHSNDDLKVVAHTHEEDPDSSVKTVQNAGNCYGNLLILKFLKLGWTSTAYLPCQLTQPVKSVLVGQRRIAKPRPYFEVQTD